MKKPVVIHIRNAQAFDFGGAERFPVFVSKIIGDAYEPVLITHSPKLLEYADGAGVRTVRGWWWSNQQWSGWRVVLFPIYILWQIILFKWYLLTFMRLRPQAVHIQSKDDFVAATYAARLMGATVIWTDHADLKHIWRNLRVWYKNPVGKLVYLAAHHAHAITVISQSERREVTSHLPEKSKVRRIIHLINNGSPDVRDKYPSTLADKFTFCSTSRLVTDKGVGEMIQAFKKFHAAHPNSQLVLVGNGPEEHDFRALAADTPAIDFVGYQADPISFVASAHVLLQPTYHEGFSISILEGFMMQKPVIATSVGGNIEMIDDDKTGILIPHKNTVALYEAMEKLYRSPKLREQLAKAARKKYEENYVFDNIVKTKYMPLYELETPGAGS